MRERNPTGNDAFQVNFARFCICPTNRKKPEYAENMRFCAFGCSSYPPYAISRKFTQEGAAVSGIKYHRDFTPPPVRFGDNRHEADTQIVSILS